MTTPTGDLPPAGDDQEEAGRVDEFMRAIDGLVGAARAMLSDTTADARLRLAEALRYFEPDCLCVIENRENATTSKRTCPRHGDHQWE